MLQQVYTNDLHTPIHRLLGMHDEAKAVRERMELVADKKIPGM